MYIKCDYCKTSIERLLSEHGNDSFQITIHCSTCIRFHGFTLQHFSVWIFNFFLMFIFGVLTPLSTIFQLYPYILQSWKLKRPQIQLRPHHFWTYTSNLTTVVNSVLKFMINGTTSILKS